MFRQHFHSTSGQIPGKLRETGEKRLKGCNRASAERANVAQRPFKYANIVPLRVY